MSNTCIKCGSKAHRYKELCDKCYKHEYYIKNKSKFREYSGSIPMSKNNKCSMFLGVHVAERVLSKVFNDVVKQPVGNPGFDFICNQGKKIDVKSSCFNKNNYKNTTRFWKFNIKKNKIPDYFLCLAFDDREKLTPLYMWLIPGMYVNNNYNISISNTTISKWDKYALDIEKVSTCCDMMRG